MRKTSLLLLAGFMFLAACSDDDAEAKKAHVWKEQTDTLNKAKAVEQTLQNAADAEQKQINNQTQ